MLKENENKKPLELICISNVSLKMKGCQKASRSSGTVNITKNV